MPHQCLKCGKIFPSGSPEILKGCSECGGKRFFYTEQPVSDKEREHLIEQANKDIKVLIREILSQSQREGFDFYDETGSVVSGVSPTSQKDWVKISPRDLKKGRPTDKKIVDEKTTTDEAGKQKLPTVKEILQELRQTIPESEMDAGVEKDKSGKTKKKKTGKELKKKKRLKKIKGESKQKAKIKVKRKKSEPKPEIITVKEPGVYDIKLDKLMKGFPIIIYRDGSYLVHLPSVFESIERKKR